MRKLKQSLGIFHPIVWVLLSGTILARGSAFMTLPFLAVYLSKTMDLHPIMIGITIGISPLTGTLGGFIGGHLSDRFGRKPVMLLALGATSLVYFGFFLAETPSAFILLNALNGLCTAFFEPTSQALISDVTEKKNRMKAFSLRYTAINIGASVGPLAGAYMAVVSAKSAFLITGLIYLAYSVVLLLMMKKYSVPGRDEGSNPMSLKGSLKIMAMDKGLRFLILGSILINLGYSQIESTLPQHLTKTMEEGVFVFSVLLSINAIMVVLLQMPLSAYSEKFKTMQVMMAGAILLSAGLLCFGFAKGWIIAIIAVLLVTVGEILIFPSSSMLVDQIAPEELRGTYFGASQFRKIGQFAGPIAGGFLLGEGGALLLFPVIAGITVCSLFFFSRGNKAVSKVEQPTNFSV
ncbi:MDR family MFS transporter [Mesobacillus zeae]|uniref:MFS transporter n=1 Tax=Mesobacillus zeae TaxID=1917180 RepID=A0A398BBV1_9BACI|nr:MFS transporter [Mesobacillus zeae]RID85166.1 MFS transporter [Mesobacillus zeae]